jgi:site-specific DNA-methyltransferase (adenine-specific)
MIEPVYSQDGVTLYQGDCLEVLPTLPDGSIDAIVTDPPYGLEFMGKEWDSLGADFKESTGDGSWAAAHGTTRKGFDGYSPIPSYTRPAGNIQCPDCGNWRDGRDPEKPDRRKGYRCVCGGALRGSVVEL